MTSATQSRLVKAIIGFVVAVCILAQFTLCCPGSKTDPRNTSQIFTPELPPAASAKPPGTRSAAAIAAKPRQ